MKTQQTNRRSRQRGAVTVEFIIAFMPMLAFFLWLMQYSFIISGKLVTKHAAVIAARAASVILDDDEANYDQVRRGSFDGKRKLHVQAAVRIVLSALPGLVLRDVSIMKSDTEAAKPNDILTPPKEGCDMGLRVRVKVRMICRIAGNSTSLASGWYGGPCQNKNAVGYRDFTEDAVFPTQASNYFYPTK